MEAAARPLIRTVRERCKVCYTCVRECPAKAIRISGGQAEVLVDRCVGCGNCVLVCRRGAKVVSDHRSDVEALLQGHLPVAAMVAPSFPAQLPEVAPERLVGALRGLGFDLVCEVAFGADLVARAYQDLMHDPSPNRWIATTCPAVVGFVERYHPDLVEHLVPIASPMVAMARVIRRLHGDAVRTVFIGPCVAKKAEDVEAGRLPEVDAALTFSELERWLDTAGVDLPASPPSPFDPPRGGEGAIFPVSRGLLQAARLQEDLLDQDVVAADGREGFAEALREFETGDLEVRLLETLCCNGCIMGPGITSEAPVFRRRAQVRDYVRTRLAALDRRTWEADLRSLADLNLGRIFHRNDQRVAHPDASGIKAILERMGKHDPDDELNCGACGYDTCREHAVAIHKGLAEHEMCLPFVIDRLRETVDELAVSNRSLARTRSALHQSERLASMGQLAAGIAHEVNNPLGVVLMYSHLLLDDATEDGPLAADLRTIVSEADRCKRIVGGLLNFARQRKTHRTRTDLRELAEHVLTLSPAPTGITATVCAADADTVAMLDGDQIIQVLTNLVGNAYAAMPEGGALTVHIRGEEDAVHLTVEDTGTGVPEGLRAKIFEPFVTTKQIGEGTGLGLSVTYGIVKMHRGDIRVDSNDDPTQGPTGTRFHVTLPRSGGEEIT